MSILPVALERGAGHVTVFLKKNEVLPPIPYELQNVYSPETWTTRVQTATQLCRRWSRPVVERIYFITALLVQFIIPSIVSSQILMRIYATNDGEIPPERFFAFRAIGMAVFIGTIILFWTPLIIWKTLGKRKLRALEAEWLTIDRATTPSGGFVPRWTITKPGVFSSTEAIRVTVPQAPVFITNFHPQATLPPYINPAPAAGFNGTNAYGYPEDEKVPFGSERV